MVLRANKRRRTEEWPACDVSEATLCLPALSAFEDLQVAPQELRINDVLPTGQVFHWHPVSAHDVAEGPLMDSEAPKTAASPECWLGVIGSDIFALKETPETTLAACLSCPDRDAWEGRLRDYLNVEKGSLRELYATWGAVDARLAAVAACLPGIRVLRQDPLECLLSFICSSNNNIARIQLMLGRLRAECGPLIGRVMLPDGSELKMHAFPTVEQLSTLTEQRLRDLGFGYRAKYIVATVEALSEQGGGDFLMKMRDMPRPEVKQQLLQYPGVGPKVADCVALFCLDQADCIPVDTHVWRIATRDYDEDDRLKSANSLTPKIYELVGDKFRDRFGGYAGWAHSLLFTAELPRLRARLPDHLVEEQLAFKEEEKVRKGQEQERRRVAREKKAAKDANR